MSAVIANGIAQAYDAGLYSDLTIQCGTRQWKVHRVIIYSASKFFLKAGEGAFKEGQTKHITISEFDPDTLDKAISYIYKLDYTAPTSPPKSALELHPEVYKLADYLDMPALKQLACSKLAAATHEAWEVVPFTKALKTIYTSTPAGDRGMRDVAKACLGSYKKSLRAHKGFTDLVEGNFAGGGLVMDVLDAWTEYRDEKPKGKDKGGLIGDAGVGKKRGKKKEVQGGDRV